MRFLEMRERELEVRDRFFGMKGEKEEKEKKIKINGAQTVLVIKD